MGSLQNIFFQALLISLQLFIPYSTAQSSCSSSISPSYPAPSAASGYKVSIIANGFSSPRSIIFDSAGHLLVVEAKKGITAVTFNDNGGSCLSVKSKTTVISDTTLNHGIQLSSDGKTLYASNTDEAYLWSYDANSMKTTSSSTTLVSGMDNPDHSTRTLLLTAKVPNMLLVSRGSDDNIDMGAEDVKTGRSQIRAFNISSGASSNFPYVYNSSGTLLGWGLRNSVGVAEHPITGGIYSVENSADDITRNGVDFHNDNPGEEMNYHSPLESYFNGSNDPVHGANFGYPNCFAVWNASEIPDGAGLSVGDQFSIGQITSTDNDTICQRISLPPRLTFPAHRAPLDIVFNSGGSLAYITSHGSWDRTIPDGYQLFAIPFSASLGSPLAPPNSTTSWTPIVYNPDISKCPNSCFRPVGLAFDSKGRLFMSSDTTGEIFVITATDGGSVDAMNVVGNVTAPAPKKKGGALKTFGGGSSMWAVGTAMLVVVLLMG